MDTPESTLKRYWVSWWSGNYASEGCTRPPFQFWCSGYRDRENDFKYDDQSLCAVIDAPDEAAIWQVIKHHYPDYEERFCEECEPDWRPGNRFPDFENRTSLTGSVAP